MSDAVVLQSVLDGDAPLLRVLAEWTGQRLVDAAHRIGPVDPVAVARVLEDQQAGHITDEVAQQWASFVRRGYLSGSKIEDATIDIEYDQEHEEAIVEAIFRLDELGDLIDGVIESDEATQLIRALRDASRVVG